MKRFVFAWSAILAAVGSAPVRGQSHHHASMAAQLRVQAQLQRAALTQQRAVARMQAQLQREAQKQQRALLRKQQQAARQQMMLQKRLAHARRPRLPRSKAPPHLKAPRALRRPPMPRRGILPKSARSMTGRLPSPQMPKGSSASGTSVAGVSSGPKMLPPLSPTPTLGPAPNPPVPVKPNPKQPPPPAPPPVVAPKPVAEEAPTPLPFLHKAADLGTDINRREPASFFLDSISAPSEMAASSRRENGIMQLVSAIAKGGSRPLRTEARTIQLDVVRQTPPLPPLQAKYFVSPLLAVD